MTIETKTRITLAGVTIEREVRWDALSILRPFSPLALLARLGEADRLDEQERERTRQTRRRKI